MGDTAAVVSRRRARTATQTQRLLTGPQVELEYGIAYRSLYDLYARGALPAVRLANTRRLRFLRADIESLISRSREVRA